MVCILQNTLNEKEGIKSLKAYIGNQQHYFLKKEELVWLGDKVVLEGKPTFQLKFNF